MARAGSPLPSAAARRSAPAPVGLRHVAGAGGAGAAGRAGGPGRRLLRQHRRARRGVLPGAGAVRHQDGAHLRGGRRGLPGHRRGGEGPPPPPRRADLGPRGGRAEGRAAGPAPPPRGCPAAGPRLRGGEAVAERGSAREGGGGGALRAASTGSGVLETLGEFGPVPSVGGGSARRGSPSGCGARGFPAPGLARRSGAGGGGAAGAGVS